MSLTDWLPLQLFRREAEALILGDSSGTGPRPARAARVERQEP
jgi:hypothetical protein